MFTPRKPHPMGNEYCTMCCGLSGAMCGIELVEGKDSPRQRPAPEFSSHAKTTGFLLRLCKPFFSTGKVVILDSGFCMLKGLIALVQHGVHALALIKKQRYWPV